MIATQPVPFSVALHQPVGAQIETKPRPGKRFSISRKPKISLKTLKPGHYGARKPFMRLP